MMDFNKHIVKELRNCYGGSGRKRAVIMDDGHRYMLKFPDPVREQARQGRIRYAGNAVSEHVGCRIAEAIGIPAQKTVLGEYLDARTGKRRIACACRDLQEGGLRLYEVGRLELGGLEARRGMTFADVEDAIGRISGIDAGEARRFFYEQLVLDALIGNTDRHNGNWGILAGEEEGSPAVMSPVFDCASCLCPLLPDKELSDAAGKAMGTYSAMRDGDGRRMLFQDCLMASGNEALDEALRRVMPRVSMDAIDGVIDGTPYISDRRKAFYKDFVRAGYERKLVPAMERISRERAGEGAGLLPGRQAFLFYKDVLAPIKRQDPFQPADVRLAGAARVAERIVNSKALVCSADADGLVADAVIPLQSSNRSVRKAAGIIASLPAPRGRRSVSFRTSNSSYSVSVIGMSVSEGLVEGTYASVTRNGALLAESGAGMPFRLTEGGLSAALPDGGRWDTTRLASAPELDGERMEAFGGGRGAEAREAADGGRDALR